MPDTCVIRERLEVDYTRAMNALANQATDDAAPLYRAAVRARMALQEHLEEHGCGVPIHKLRARL